jgi:hypothetical protein
MATETITNDKYNWPDIKRGDSFEERQIAVTVKDDDGNDSGNPPPGNLTDVRIKFKYGKKDGPLSKYIFVGSGIVIDDPANWFYTIEEFPVDSNFELGLHFYDIELTGDSTTIKTTPGGTMEVFIDVTDA